MATSQGRKNRGLDKFSATLLHRKLNFSVVAAILLTFVIGGVGGYYVGKSQAAASTCVFGTFSPGSSGQCAGDIQYILNSWDANTGGHSGFARESDSDYGHLTQGDVKIFQNWCNARTHDVAVIHATRRTGCLTLGAVDLSVDGVVGEHTWYAMCFNAPIYGYQYDDAGCAARKTW